MNANSSSKKKILLAVVAAGLLTAALQPQFLAAKDDKKPVATQEKKMAKAAISGDTTEYKASDVLGSVGDKKYTTADVDTHIEKNPRFAAYKKAAATNTGALNRLRKAALEQIIDRKLLLENAEKSGVKFDDELKGRFDQIVQGYGGEEKLKPLLEQTGSNFTDFSSGVKEDLLIERYLSSKVANDIAVTDAELKAEYEANSAKYGTPAQVKARHILIKVDAKATDEDTKKALEKIKSIEKEAKQPKADFAELAKKHSEGPSAPRGGDLNYFTKGQMVKEFEQTAFALKPGEISEPVKTQFGYHLIKVEDKKEEKKPSFDEAKDKVTQVVKSKKQREVVASHLKGLRESSNVTIALRN